MVDETSPPSSAEVDFTGNLMDRHVSVSFKATYLSIIFLNRPEPTLKARAKFTVIACCPTHYFDLGGCRDFVGGISDIIVIALRSSFIYDTFLWVAKHTHYPPRRIICPQPYPCSFSKYLKSIFFIWKT